MKKIFLIATMAFGFTMMSGAFAEAGAQQHTVKVEHKKGLESQKKIWCNWSRRRCGHRSIDQ
jgi:hypothetical protein